LSEGIKGMVRRSWWRSRRDQASHVDIDTVAADANDGGGRGGRGGSNSVYSSGDGSCAATGMLGVTAAADGSSLCRACAQSSSSMWPPRWVEPPSPRQQHRR